MAFYVYENWTRKRGRAHVGECSHCNHGIGKNAIDSGNNGKWYKFETKEQADFLIEELSQKGYDMKWCATCT